MNKKLMMMLLAGLLSMVLVACGNSEEDKEDTKSDTEKQEDEKEIKVVTADLFHKKFFNDSFGMDALGVYGTLKNEGETPVIISDVEITLFNDEDKAIEVNTGQEDIFNSTAIAPVVMDVDEKSFINLYLDYKDKYKELDHVEIDYEAKPISADKLVNIELDKDSINPMGELQEPEEWKKEDMSEGTIQGREDIPVTDADITFNIENKDDRDAKYYAGIGVYDEDGELLGTVLDTEDLEDDHVLKSGKVKNVEALDSVPFNMDNIDHVEVYVGGIEADESDYLEDSTVEEAIEGHFSEETDQKEDSNKSNDKEEDSELDQNDKKETASLDSYSEEEIEYARVWMQFMEVQDITELNVNKVSVGTPINPHVDKSSNYPEDVVILTSDMTANGIITYSSNGDGTINIYPIPSQFPPEEFIQEEEGMDMQEYTQYLTDNTEKMDVAPLDDDKVAEFLDSVDIKYM
ncbi:hypothetical protein ABRT01_12985 [Lentibacillus sp. L22]|uniref:hypothetical protein n=1 Tax=Lentibacillus TaxID=175304 RepID=UPI0022B15134|nr:hypothetical protein [Lentibacillus daqui]